MSGLYDAVLIELLVLVLAIICVGYIVSTTPPSSTLPMQQTSPFAPPSVMPRVPDILTVPEAAAYLHVSEAEVMRLIDEGKLPAARIGDSFRIARIAIEDFLKQER
jgi:excisionase family DNA binding protein